MSMKSEHSDEDDITQSENKRIDQLTLELLINKTQYEKYLAKSEPQKWSEKQAFLANCEKYYNPIMKITSQYLKDPDTQLGIDVDNAFSNYAQCIIRHLEIKELANANIDNIDEVDEDILFPDTSHIVGSLDDDRDYSQFEDFSRDNTSENTMRSQTKSRSSHKMDYLSRDFFRLAKKNPHI